VCHIISAGITSLCCPLRQSDSQSGKKGKTLVALLEIDKVSSQFFSFKESGRKGQDAIA
jgi:hypothetical protein